MEQQTSAFVRTLMAGRSEVEIREAERRWFAYLKIMCRMIARHEREKRPDSAEPGNHARFE